MQEALRAAKKELERPSLVRKDIVAMIRPEPDNEKDTKAIVIEINYSEGYKAIGYVPSETNLISSLINCPEQNSGCLAKTYYLQDSVQKSGPLCCYHHRKERSMGKKGSGSQSWC